MDQMDQNRETENPAPADVQRALYRWLHDRAVVVLPPVDAELRRLASDLPRPGEGPLSAQVDASCGWLERASEDWRGVPDWMSRTLELIRLDLQDGSLSALVSDVGGLGDSSDLTRDQLARAAWMLLEVDGDPTGEARPAEAVEVVGVRNPEELASFLDGVRAARLRTMAELREEVRDSCMTSLPDLRRMTRTQLLAWLGERDPTPEELAQGIVAVTLTGEEYEAAWATAELSDVELTREDTGAQLLAAAESARCRAILDGRGDSSDLTHDELRAAMWMCVDVDDPETRAETGARLLARAAERMAEAAPGSAWVLAPSGAGPVGARSFPVVPMARAEDAARLYAFVVCHPGAPVSDAWHRVACPSRFCTLLNGHAGAHVGRSGATWTDALDAVCEVPGCGRPTVCLACHEGEE